MEQVSGDNHWPRTAYVLKLNTGEFALWIKTIWYAPKRNDTVRNSSFAIKLVSCTNNHYKSLYCRFLSRFYELTIGLLLSSYLLLHSCYPSLLVIISFKLYLSAYQPFASLKRGVFLKYIDVRIRRPNSCSVFKPLTYPRFTFMVPWHAVKPLFCL